jgi:hypothetical protein
MQDGGRSFRTTVISPTTATMGNSGQAEQHVKVLRGKQDQRNASTRHYSSPGIRVGRNCGEQQRANNLLQKLMCRALENFAGTCGLGEKRIWNIYATVHQNDKPDAAQVDVSRAFGVYSRHDGHTGGRTSPGRLRIIDTTELTVGRSKNGVMVRQGAWQGDARSQARQSRNRFIVIESPWSLDDHPLLVAGNGNQVSGETATYALDNSTNKHSNSRSSTTANHLMGEHHQQPKQDIRTWIRQRSNDSIPNLNGG